MRRTLVLAVLWLDVLFVAGSLALADEVVLKSGGRVRGKAVQADGQVRVELESGTVAFPESYVERVIPGTPPAEIKARERRERRAWLQDRLAAVDRGDAQALYSLARAARGAGFPEEEVREVLGLVLGADPDHAGARFDLGEELYGGRWVSREEAHRLERRDHAAEMRARGYVDLNGVWMPRDEAEWRLQQRECAATIEDLESSLDECDLAVRERDTEALELAQDVSDLEAELEDGLSRESELLEEIEELENKLKRLRWEVHACAVQLEACRDRPH